MHRTVIPAILSQGSYLILSYLILSYLILSYLISSGSAQTQGISHTISESSGRNSSREGTDQMWLQQLLTNWRTRHDPRPYSRSRGLTPNDRAFRFLTIPDFQQWARSSTSTGLFSQGIPGISGCSLNPPWSPTPDVRIWRISWSGQRCRHLPPPAAVTDLGSTVVSEAVPSV